MLGRLGSCICVFAKEDRVGQGTCSRRPSTDACLPCPSSHGHRPAWGCSRRSLLVETAQRRPSWRRGGETASGQGPGENLAQAFYTLQCNFFILFYSDYDYSGILSQISLGLAF